MATPTREEVMADPSVHNLTKEILRLSENKDIVDRVYDVELALRVLKEEERQAGIRLAEMDREFLRV